MRHLRKPVYLLMAALVLSTPLLACSLPGLTLSEEEKECCRQMADRCGSSQMEESHSCCTKVPKLAGGTLQVTIKYSLSALDLAGHIAPAIAQPCIAGVAVGTSEILHCSKSPPGHTPVLRI